MMGTGSSSMPGHTGTVTGFLSTCFGIGAGLIPPVIGKLIALMGYPTTDNAALTIVTYISDFGSIRYEMGYACALSFILFVMIIAVHWLVDRIINKYAST